MRLSLILQTLWMIGIFNISRALIYKLLINCGLHPSILIKHNIGGSNFFDLPAKLKLNPEEISTNWEDFGQYFGWYKIQLNGEPPKWHTNPFNGKIIENYLLPWWKMSDFNLNIGDIKTVWEASRFEWVLIFALRARLGDKFAIKKLNIWLADWCKNNPTYFGANWKCGQEASIRVIHLSMAAKFLNQKTMSTSISRLIVAHLHRISSSTAYGISQDNNHATSEAAALYMGGIWCKNNNIKNGNKWAKKGRTLLERAVSRLISSDGSFSQYSINYHRLLLDTLSAVEIWRLWQNDKIFSSHFYHKSRLATKWLFTMVIPENGDVPNIGANDGAHLLAITNSDYRDYRPTIQLAMAVFHHSLAYDNEGLYNFPLMLHNLNMPRKKINTPNFEIFDKGGYVVLRKKHFTCVLKYPRYQFRPKQSDALHLDVWIGSKNILRDGGTYKYNSKSGLDNYFSGVQCHNTIEFDDRDQMPRLGRFIRGGWLNSKNVNFSEFTNDEFSVSAGYHDWKSAYHNRAITINPKEIIIKDSIGGFAKHAVLRWRLIPDKWILNDYSLVGKYCTIKMDANVPFETFNLVEGWESRYYYQKSEIPVLEISFGTDVSEIITEIRLK